MVSISGGGQNSFNLTDCILPPNYTVEGKFSDFPAFISSLENKFCFTPVTYRISEDEDLGDIVGTQRLFALTSANITLYNFRRK